MIGVIISAFIFISYCVWSFWKCGITTTLSETHYHLPKWMFPIAMISSALLILPYWLEVNTQFQFLAFISCAGIVFLGAAPLFKNEDRKIHITAVFVAGISALIWALITNWVVTCILAVIMGILMLVFKKYWALIMELSMFVCIYLMLLI